MLYGCRLRKNHTPASFTAVVDRISVGTEGLRVVELSVVKGMRSGIRVEDTESSLDTWGMEGSISLI